MKFQKYLNERRYYTGTPMETGGTSRAGGTSPSIKWLFKKGFIQKGDRILDYGAGKYARNSDFFRDLGFECYAYDPFNSNGSDGYSAGNVSNTLPREKFDIGFTSFVLNVVPKYIQDDIVKTIKSSAYTSYHIVRNKDIFDTIKNALKRGDKATIKYIESDYLQGEEVPDSFSDDFILDLCEFGVATSRGFQRIPHLEDDGAKLLYSCHNYKIYEF